MKKIIIYSETIQELKFKIIGYFHDHCYHLYFGSIKNIPTKYEKLIDNKKGKYVFICDEDIPLKN
jgi:hypothetical protein